MSSSLDEGTHYIQINLFTKNLRDQREAWTISTKHTPLPDSPTLKQDFPNKKTCALCFIRCLATILFKTSYVCQNLHNTPRKTIRSMSMGYQILITFHASLLRDTQSDLHSMANVSEITLLFQISFTYIYTQESRMSTEKKQLQFE